MIKIKSSAEIDIMRKAGEIVALVHQKLSEVISPGITTKELDRIAEEIIRSKGAVPSFKGYRSYTGACDYPASICASINEEVIHGIPGLRNLKDGDIISIDIGACYQGYHGDAARTFGCGNISKRAKRLIEVTEQSFYKALEYAKEGCRICDLSAAVQKHAESNGYSVIREYVGHGIGTQMHEEPQIPNFVSREKGPRLRAGMTLAIEPMVVEGDIRVTLKSNEWTVVTVDAGLSAHYENTIAVTEDKPLLLTVL